MCGLAKDAISKNSTFFNVLLLFSLSIFLTIKNSEKTEVYAFPFTILSTDQRNNLIEGQLFEYKQVASEKLRQDIVKATEGYHHIKICNLLLCLKEEVSETISFEEICKKIPTIDKRAKMIRKILSDYRKSAPEFLVQGIIELTGNYNILQINLLLSDMAGELASGPLNQKNCLNILQKAINELDDEQNKKEKLAQIEEIRESFIKTDFEIKSKITDEQEIYPESDDTKYPSLDDMFHQKIILFKAAARQLKAGKFKKGFRRGMLLYGLPGEGKTAMVKAMANESNCRFFKISAAKLVNKYQGSGAGAIQEIFAEAKAIEADKGVIVFIDELESLSPKTTDENIKFASKYSGQDLSNALTQIWTEYDDCSENHDNILVVAASNKLEVIDKRIRDRFRCIEFSCPDKDNAYKILKNKAEYFNVPLSEAELQHHVKRMEGLSGRELTTFIEDIKGYISEDMSKEKALELVTKEQVKTKNNAKPSSKRFDQLMNEAAKGAAHGFGGALGGGLVAGTLMIFGLSIKKVKMKKLILIILIITAIEFSLSFNGLYHEPNQAKAWDRNGNEIELISEWEKVGQIFYWKV